MRLFNFFGRPGRESEAQTASRLCQAKTGVGINCKNLALPGKRLCDFHSTLVGPWSKPDRFFKDIN